MLQRVTFLCVMYTWSIGRVRVNMDYQLDRM